MCDQTYTLCSVVCTTDAREVCIQTTVPKSGLGSGTVSSLISLLVVATGFSHQKQAIAAGEGGCACLLVNLFAHASQATQVAAGAAVVTCSLLTCRRTLQSSEDHKYSLESLGTSAVSWGSRTLRTLHQILWPIGCRANEPRHVVVRGVF